MPLFTRPRVGPAATVFGRCALPPAAALAVIGPIDLPSVFRRWGPFPAVTGVEGQTGGWTSAGETRHPQFSDGGSALETIVERTDGVGFAYELTGFTDVFDRLVHGVRGEWTFTPDGDGSIVRWTWEFAPRVGRRLLVAGAVVPLWKQYMRRVMAASIALADGSAAH